MTHRYLKQLIWCIKVNYLSDCWLMRPSLVEPPVVLSSSDECVGSYSVAWGSCRCSPALMSLWQWGYTERWRKMAVYLYRKHSSKTGVQLQHRQLRACPTVGIKHKCGTLWEILGHLRECFKPPSTLPFPPPPLFLLPSLSLSSCPHPNLNPPLPQHLVALFWWEEYHCVKRGSEIVLEHNGCSSQAVHWCCDALCLSLYVFVEVLPPTLINNPLHATTTHTYLHHTCISTCTHMTSILTTK